MSFSGVLLLTLGLLWPRLNLGATTSRIAFWFLIYSDFATVAAFLMAGVWGAGNSIIPLAAGAAHGSDFLEAAISVVAYSAAPTGITSFALVLWGLRLNPSPREIEGAWHPPPVIETRIEGKGRWANKSR